MNIEKLKDRSNSEQNKKLLAANRKMQQLIQALEKKEIPTEILIVINKDIELINSFLPDLFVAEVRNCGGNSSHDCLSSLL